MIELRIKDNFFVVKNCFRWGNNGNSDRLYFWGEGESEITADGDYSHEIKWCLLLGRKVMINLDGILKSRETLLGQQSFV